MISEEDQADAPDLNALTKSQLIRLAEENGVEGVSSRMTKAQIIDVIGGEA